MAERGEFQTSIYLLLERAAIGFLALKPDWVVHYANPSAEAMLNVGSVRGRNFLDLLLDEFSFSPGARAGTGEVFSIERKQDADGESHRYLVSLWPVGGGEREDHWTLALVRPSPDRALEARSSDEYLALFSHRLLSPLAAISANLSLLARPDLLREPEDRASVVAEARAAADRLRRTIDLILALEAIPNGGRTHTRPSDVREILEVQTANVRLRHPGIHAEVEISTELGETGLPLVPRELAVVVENLVENALKFCASQNPTVRVQASVAGACATLTVSDNGQGIPPEDHERIFDRFFQRQDAAGSCGGAGLGLALVKKIIRARGGTLSLRSAPGEGTTVRIDLPLESQDGPLESQPSAASDT